MRLVPRFLVLAALFLVPLVPGRTLALPQCEDPDLAALVFDNGEINLDGQPAFTSLSMDLVLLNPSAPVIGGVEFALPSQPGTVMTGISWPVPVVDVGTGENHIVGFGNPVYATGDAVLLATINYIYTSSTGEVVDFFLAPAQPASIPGTMAYLDFNTSAIIPMNPISGDYDLPVARLNGEHLHYCETEPLALDWQVTLATAGDLDNLAGVAASATDGYDPDFDLVDGDPDRKIYFPHPEWYPGADHQRDIKAVYDPTTEVKQWNFVVESLSDQSGGEMVTLDISTDLDLSPGFDAFLTDHSTGVSFDLLPDRVYQYAVPYGSSSRSFELVIGTEFVPPPADPLAFSLDVTSGLFADRDNVGAVAENATDGFDPGLDVPEPGNPPSDYLMAYFPHPEWPLGSYYQTDVRAVYDPLTDLRTWPVTVATDQTGSVLMSFDPNFAADAGIGFQLKDLANNTTYDLFPALTFSFENDGLPVVRNFEVTVGSGQGLPELNPVSRHLTAGWSLIGAPLVPDPAAATLGDLIMDQAPGYSYLFQYLGPQGYGMLGADDPAVQAQGYWFATTEGFEWTMDGERDEDGVVTPLVKGWNQVGYPLWFPGPVSGLRVSAGGTTYTWAQAVSAGLVNPNVFGYDPSAQDYLTVNILAPWTGYWIRAQVDGVVLEFDWPNFQVLPLVAAKPDFSDLPDEQKWRTDLVLRDAADRYNLLTMGVDPLAAAGYDPLLDRPQPPLSPAGGTRFSIDHPEWEALSGRFYATDFVAPETEKLVWNTVITTEAPGPVTLTWTLFDWPRGHDLQLYLPGQNRVVVASMAGTAEVTLEVGTQPLVVQVRTPDLMSDAGDLPGLAYGIGAHPNPFNPVTTIAYTLPAAGKAEVRVFSLRGELVAVLEGDVKEAGRHETVWRGQDRKGHAVPSGSYFAKLYVDGKDVGPVTKMSLVR